MLGHGSIALTMDTYSHVLPSMQEDAASKMEGAAPGATKERFRLPEWLPAPKNAGTLQCGGSLLSA